MSKRIIHCQKLNSELEGLDKPPYPGKLGDRIYENISQKAWDSWIEEQTKIINELSLKVFQKESKELLMKKAEQFLFDPTSYTGVGV